MDISDHAMFARRLAELSGESRDRGLRPFLEKQAEKLIGELFDDIHNLAAEWFDANISLVTNLDHDIGTVFLGKNEAIKYFEGFEEERAAENEDTHLNFVLVSADRGRVTSHVELFSKNDIPGPTKKEVILITMDLNDSNMIQRMEIRLLHMEYGKYEDRVLSWDETVKKIGNKPVVIDYTI